MSWKLFLDDQRTPPNNTWTVARTVAEAKELVQQHGVPQNITFDYYMGSGVPTGLDFAKWLAERFADGDKWPKGFHYSIHTSDPGYATDIQDVMYHATGQYPVHFDMEWWNTVTVMVARPNPETGESELVSVGKRPMTPLEIEQRAARQKQQELEESPEYIEKQLKRRAEALGAITWVDKDSVSAELHEECDEPVLIKARTMKDLSYILGILNDEVH